MKEESTISSESENNLKKGFIATWGPVVGFFGGILGGVSILWSLLDRLIPPQLSLCQVMPICIEAPRSTDEPHISVLGIGAIVRCRAGNKTVFVSGLDYFGKKALSISEYIPNIQRKMSQKEIESEVARKKPFERIEWNGLPYDQPTAVRIEPYEEKYIKFIFLEPAPFFYVQEGGSPHVGFEEPGTEPERIRMKPSLYDIFKLRLNTKRDEKDGPVWSIWAPYGLRDDVAIGRLQFEIRVGSIPEAIRPEEIVGFRTITQDDWKRKTAQQLFQERSLGFIFNPLSKEGRTENRRFKDFRGLK